MLEKYKIQNNLKRNSNKSSCRSGKQNTFKEILYYIIFLFIDSGFKFEFKD
jgi:hypothetical protein